jgi:hypothetical protein
MSAITGTVRRSMLMVIAGVVLATGVAASSPMSAHAQPMDRCRVLWSDYLTTENLYMKDKATLEQLSAAFDAWYAC